MPMQLDTGAIKAESRSLLRTGEVNPFRMTLFYLLITLVLDMINSGVSYMIDSAGGFTVLSFSFVSILVGLVALVLNAGYYCYCFGILRREEMPYESLFDAFPFAGKVILLSIVEGVFIFLWSMLFVIPGIIAAYRYSFAMLNLCENPELGVMEALNLSKRQTNGYKMQLFLLQLSFIGYQIAAVLIALLYEYVIISYLPDSLSGAVLGALIFVLHKNAINLMCNFINSKSVNKTVEFILYEWFPFPIKDLNIRGCFPILYIFCCHIQI